MKVYTYRIEKEKVMLVCKYETLTFYSKEHNFSVTPICVADFFVVNKFYKYDYPSIFSTLKPLSKRQKNILLRKHNEIEQIKNQYQ